MYVCIIVGIIIVNYNKTFLKEYDGNSLTTNHHLLLCTLQCNVDMPLKILDVSEI